MSRNRRELQQMRKKGHYAKACRQKFNNNRTVKRLTEDEMNEPNESSCESEESIHHIKEIRKIEETNKHYTANVKINGVIKEFIIDTGSPISIMPPDKRIMKTKNNTPKIHFGTTVSDREEKPERHGTNQCRNNTEKPTLLERSGRKVRPMG